jgi:hypothetical protein
MKTEDRRTCPSCGYWFSEAMEFCPVCMLPDLPGVFVDAGGTLALQLRQSSAL